MNILYDISVLGTGHTNPLARTGVARVVENVARGLMHHPDCTLRFTTLPHPDHLNAALDYLTATPEFSTVPLPHSPFLLENYRTLNTLQHRITLQRQQTQTPPQLLNALTNALQPLQTTLAQAQPLLFAESLAAAQILHHSYFPLPDTTAYPQLQRFLTVCDLIPILHPEFFGVEKPEDHVVYHALQSIDPQRDWVLCISEATKRDLCDYLSIERDRVFVTPLAAASDLFYPETDPQKIRTAHQKYGIPNAPYFLSLSTLEPRKNIQQTIRCFGELYQSGAIPDAYLVLVGSLGWNYDQLFADLNQNEQVKSRVILTGRVEDADLAAIYSPALAFVYPSFYEGFGLPPLEAMQCGVPVITSDNSSLPEVVGDAGIMVNPRDTPALKQGMLDLYRGNELRQTMAQQSRLKSQEFSWNRCVDAVISAYKIALSV
jgi:glycosyltransferase involved in cell wall biosynthesis